MNLFNSNQLPMQNPFAQNNNIRYARSGEPISVNGRESVDSFPTVPNSITILFHESQPVFYRKATDANNHPIVELYHYEKMELAPDTPQYVTLEDFKKLKEELINEWKHIWDEPAASAAANANLATDAGNKANDADAGSKSNSGADASNTSKSESSIW